MHDRDRAPCSESLKLVNACEKLYINEKPEDNE